MSERVSTTGNPIERHIGNALGKVFPERAIDIGAILAIVTALVPIVTGCFSARRTKQQIKSGSFNVLVAANQAALRSGYSPAESIDIALAIRSEGMEADADDVDGFVDDCMEFGS